MSGSMPVRVVRVAAVVLGLLGMARLAAAHALGTECTLHDGVVRLEAYFDDDTAAADARVVVRNAASEIVVEGRTDAKGLWHFPAPPPDLYRVTVDAGVGHQTTIRLRILSRAEHPSTPASIAENVQEGPSRAEFTRFPWGGMTLGLAAIALLFLIWRGLRGWQQRGSGMPRGNSVVLPKGSREKSASPLDGPLFRS